MGRQKKIDVLIVHPGSLTAPSAWETVEPPVWAALVAGFLRDRGESVTVLDVAAEGLSPEQAAERVLRENPLLVSVVLYGDRPSASTEMMPMAQAVSREIKKSAPNQKILFVGGHVAALPEKTLTEADCDFTCGGEGPYTVLELLEALKSGGDNLGRVRGLCYRNGATVVSNASSPLVQDLDREMAGPAWDLFPLDRYLAPAWHAFGSASRQPYGALVTTLGCPYHCNFCAIQAPFRAGERTLAYSAGVNSWRRWSADAVLRQIDFWVKEKGARTIKIADELFFSDPEHVKQICEKIAERGYDLNLFAHARVDTVQDDMIERLAKAGFRWLAFGIESGNAKVREAIDKKVKQEEIFSVIKKVRKAGINVLGSFMFGLPNENLQSMRETLGLALELNCEFAEFHLTMAYPGSELYTQAQDEGRSLPENWAAFNEHASEAVPFGTKYLTSEEVLEFRDRAVDVYFNSSRYLELVEKKFGGEALNSVRQMTAHKLGRRLLEGHRGK